MLKIGLDVRATEPDFRAHFGRGTGRYVSELSKALFALEDINLQIVGIGSEHLSPPQIWQRCQRFIPGRQTLETQLFLPRRMKKLGFEALHFPFHGDATARATVPYCISVLDLIPLKFKDLYCPTTVNWRYHLARHLEIAAIAKARGILAISETTKRDLVELLKIPEEKIVIYADRMVDIYVDKIVPDTNEKDAEDRFVKILRQYEKYGKNEITLKRYIVLHQEIHEWMND